MENYKGKLDVTVSLEVTRILPAFAVTLNHSLVASDPMPYIRDVKLMYICKSHDCAVLHLQFKDNFVVKTNI